jgi:hypothetical protein
MNLFAHLGGPVAFRPMLALALYASDDGDSGTRTLMGAAAVLAVIAVVIAAGLILGRGARA